MYVYEPYDLFSNRDTLFTMSCEMLCYKILNKYCLNYSTKNVNSKLHTEYCKSVWFHEQFIFVFFARKKNSRK